MTALDVAFTLLFAELRQAGQEYLVMAERAVNAEADRDAYRLLSQQALHRVHELTLESDRRDVRYRQVVDEYRRFRAGVMREAVHA